MSQWKEEISRNYSDYGIDLAIDIIGEAYEEGLINWNVYRKAMDKIKTNSNGSWMFEYKKEVNK
jgi:hypothetical protein